MALTRFTGADNTIRSLSDTPNQSDGLTAAQLKTKFDQFAIDQKAYDDILATEIEGQFATNEALQDVIAGEIDLVDTATGVKYAWGVTNGLLFIEEVI
jgi:hypothetical protein